MMIEKVVIGRVEKIKIPDIASTLLHARIDTGAKTSSISAKANLCKDGRLEVIFLSYANKKPHYFRHYTTTVVASSNGHAEERYKIRLTLILKKKRIRAHFTLADRSTQVYPVLIGRNVLHGKFVVDVTKGSPLRERENARTFGLQMNKER